MGRKPKPETVHLARRVAIIRAVIFRGVPAQIAEVRLAIWKAEAAARGLDRNSPTFWDGAAEWIEEQRGSPSPSSSRRSAT